MCILLLCEGVCVVLYCVLHFISIHFHHYSHDDVTKQWLVLSSVFAVGCANCTLSFAT
jgi:hypothetical protein